mmetsp:Transcript_5611/g.8488  ORF Transcript_5611/g.8488 Transcript_5611/m.8488 type:complete len:332 (-) Transcript_5611:608-1603(-)|eukprot:CAMPEP_0201508428 /NCGR_PEP_ID=MMETSP0161_2-20130828/1809_1 /ASSEMBLY_ACC=CAM_ASM_000251 /TAXON_ID=180227 /ORGANISM="Neoparamoeba aestuarina, Strain SoJaBio B1-5/56/2" /LENGTH=331 /DNA_ID=CAMNT_0047903099 /DNA_START=97 /DNA_END=1092 /DNA_ORIENTATION=-
MKLLVVLLAVVVLGVIAGPCDIYKSDGHDCVAAHSTVRALYDTYVGPLYQVQRVDNGQTTDIGVKSGIADAAEQDSFCAGTDCVILQIYDQSPMKNDLAVAPGGSAWPHPDNPANATRTTVEVGGRTVYGIYIEGREGYRRDNTTGVATGDDPETMYMIANGRHYNDKCCFDYGNAETSNIDSGDAKMEAVYWGNATHWGHGGGNGPWVLADLENGLWPGNERVNDDLPSIDVDFVFAMVKGRSGGFAIKAGDAQGGGKGLQTLYDGDRSDGYNPMKKKGAIILGIGGDNSNRGSRGTFYEGIMTAGYSSDAADAKVYDDVVAVGYANAME